MRKVLGLLGLLATLVVLACAWEMVRSNGRVTFLSPQNLRNVTTWVGLFGILSLGQAYVIITGGIDLSVGSLVGLIGTVGVILLKEKGIHPVPGIGLVLLLSCVVGLWHGLLVTRLRIQPFIVTLCGLFFYRGAARYVAGDYTHGFGTELPGLRWLGSGFVAGIVPVPFVILLLLVGVVGAHLHFTAHGRHLFALGANEEGARFSGIPTERLKLTAYVLCSLIAGAGGLLIAFKVNSVGPSDFGNFYELYAVAGAVLGGCSLRGGSGNILGILIGASLLLVLRNLVNILEIRSELEYVVIGGAILVGVCADELLSRRRQGPRLAA